MKGTWSRGGGEREREERAGMVQGKLPLRKHLKTAQRQCQYYDPANLQNGLKQDKKNNGKSKDFKSWVSKLSEELSFCVGKIR